MIILQKRRSEPTAALLLYSFYPVISFLTFSWIESVAGLRQAWLQEAQWRVLLGIDAFHERSLEPRLLAISAVSLGLAAATLLRSPISSRRCIARGRLYAYGIRASSHHGAVRSENLCRPDLPHGTDEGMEYKFPFGSIPVSEAGRINALASAIVLIWLLFLLLPQVGIHAVPVSRNSGRRCADERHIPIFRPFQYRREEVLVYYRCIYTGIWSYFSRPIYHHGHTYAPS